MKHLYIIGNGFDLFTGLKTEYVHFMIWLVHHYPFVYENLDDTFNIDGEWWNDFEIGLGKLDVNEFVSKYNSHKIANDEISKTIEERRNKELEAFNKKYPNLISFHEESPCAHRLAGLLDILQYCFEKWVHDVMLSIDGPKYTHIEKNDSFFITFNYTDTLQVLYNIPDKQVLHIHGRASKHEHLVFGHNKMYSDEMFNIYDADQVWFELNRYQKNPYEYIHKYYDQLSMLKGVEFVHVYGFSFSPIDYDYIDWIAKHASSKSKWEISWHTEEDKKRISEFIVDHPSLKDRYNTIQLQKIE